MKRTILIAIRLYQRFLSFDTGLFRLLLGRSTCRFSPTCSQYTYEAIKKHGIIQGLLLGGKRIIRCRPGAL